MHVGLVVMMLSSLALQTRALSVLRMPSTGLKASFRSCAALYAAKSVVFLGTPDVAARSLELLVEASSADKALNFEVTAVVTMPPSPQGRKKVLTPSPVHTMADSLNIPVMHPEKAKDPDFLSQLMDLAPDLCITAAYGNFLPTKFLKIPKYGTLNIHPSLLPKYRGAAPVQRCLENGDATTGVSVAFTVLKMDAGPVVRQVTHPLTGDEKANTVLLDMFEVGTAQLLEALPSVWDGSVERREQVDDDATPADKLSVEDARLDLGVVGALQAHNRARGFAIWPGLWISIRVGDAAPHRLKIVTTRVLEDAVGSSEPTRLMEEVRDGKTSVLRVVCGDGSVLGVTHMQVPGKNIVDARSFVNGLRGQDVHWCDPE
jgi:methionyl-tRNA formyltransferase